MEGLSAIQEALRCLGLPEEQPVLGVSTPHLTSPNRHGQHWRELSALTLDTLSNEIRASSVLLQAQEHFLNAGQKSAVTAAAQSAIFYWGHLVRKVHVEDSGV